MFVINCSFGYHDHSSLRDTTIVIFLKIKKNLVAPDRCPWIICLWNWPEESYPCITEMLVYYIHSRLRRFHISHVSVMSCTSPMSGVEQICTRFGIRPIQSSTLILSRSAASPSISSQMLRWFLNVKTIGWKPWSQLGHVRPSHNLKQRVQNLRYKHTAVRIFANVVDALFYLQSIFFVDLILCGKRLVFPNVGVLLSGCFQRITYPLIPSPKGYISKSDD